MSETQYRQPLKRWFKYYSLFGHYLGNELLEEERDSMNILDLKRPEDMSFEERIDFVKNFTIAAFEAKKDIMAHSVNPDLDTANFALDMFSMLLTVLIEKFLLNRSYACPENLENNSQIKELEDLLMYIMASGSSTRAQNVLLNKN